MHIIAQGYKGQLKEAIKKFNVLPGLQKDMIAETIVSTHPIEFKIKSAFLEISTETNTKLYYGSIGVCFYAEKVTYENISVFRVTFTKPEWGSWPIDFSKIHVSLSESKPPIFLFQKNIFQTPLLQVEVTNYLLSLTFEPELNPLMLIFIKNIDIVSLSTNYMPRLSSDTQIKFQTYWRGNGIFVCSVILDPTKILLVGRERFWYVNKKDLSRYKTKIKHKTLEIDRAELTDIDGVILEHLNEQEIRTEQGFQ